MKGSRPPPCSGFSLTMIDEEHAVMFGGLSPSSVNSADVYVLHLLTMVSGLLLCTISVVPVLIYGFTCKSINVTEHRKREHLGQFIIL